MALVHPTSKPLRRPISVVARQLNFAALRLAVEADGASVTAMKACIWLRAGLAERLLAVERDRRVAATRVVQVASDNAEKNLQFKLSISKRSL